MKNNNDNISNRVVIKPNFASNRSFSEVLLIKEIHQLFRIDFCENEKG